MQQRLTITIGKHVIHFLYQQPVTTDTWLLTAAYHILNNAAQLTIANEL